MLIVCDRNGPVPAAEIGLPNNPESDHRRGVVSRAVRLWNQTSRSRPLKVFEIQDRFPFERWDPEAFELLVLAKPASGGGGGGDIMSLFGTFAGDLTLNGDLYLDGGIQGPRDIESNAMIPLSGFTTAGAHFYRFRAVFDYSGSAFAGSAFVFHGVPGNVASSHRVLSASAGLIHTDADPDTVIFGGDAATSHRIYQVDVINDRVQVSWRPTSGNVNYRIFVTFDYF